MSCLGFSLGPIDSAVYIRCEDENPRIESSGLSLLEIDPKKTPNNPNSITSSLGKIGRLEQPNLRRCKDTAGAGEPRAPRPRTLTARTGIWLHLTDQLVSACHLQCLLLQIGPLHMTAGPLASITSG